MPGGVGDLWLLGTLSLQKHHEYRGGRGADLITAHAARWTSASKPSRQTCMSRRCFNCSRQQVGAGFPFVCFELLGFGLVCARRKPANSSDSIFHAGIRKTNNHFLRPYFHRLGTLCAQESRPVSARLVATSSSCTVLLHTRCVLSAHP